MIVKWPSVLLSDTCGSEKGIITQLSQIFTTSNLFSRILNPNKLRESFVDDFGDCVKLIYMFLLRIFGKLSLFSYLISPSFMKSLKAWWLGYSTIGVWNSPIFMGVYVP